MTEKLSLNGVATDYFPSHHNLVLLHFREKKHEGVKCKLFSSLYFLKYRFTFAPNLPGGGSFSYFYMEGLKIILELNID